MGQCISLYQKQFLNALSGENKEVMINSVPGDHLSIVSNCGSKINGIFESFEDGGILLLINFKSKVLVRGENIDKLNNLK